MDAMKTPYAAPVADVLVSVDATADGLSSAQSQQRLLEHGPNKLPEPPGKNPILVFLGFFNDILIYILLGSAVLKALLGDWVDVVVIAAVAIINALIGFLQEGQAEKAIRGIRGMLSETADVLRDGSWVRIDASALVPGDVIRVAPGDKVPADARILSSTSLRADEAALTGETVPASKGSDPVAQTAGLGDRTSMLYSGTIITSGQGTAVVTGTGEGTEIGAIQSMVQGVENFETPLTRQLRVLGTQISIAILGMAAVMALVGRYVHDLPLGELVSATIGFAVAAIPEGLPALVTITLAVGVQAMARRNAITRRLTAIETLGSVTTICSDKTGTLTTNEMTVREIVTAKRDFTVTGTGYAPEGEIHLSSAPVQVSGFPDLSAVVEAVAACNDAQIHQDESGRWMLVGEPTEGALRTLALKAGYADSDQPPRVSQIPFDSAHKYMATMNSTEEGPIIFLKGAPDRLLDRSSTQLSPNGKLRELDRAYWEQQIDALSAKGLRVLAAASISADGVRGRVRRRDVAEGLTFRGLVGIIDPPRPEAIAAIGTCHAAGIEVTMITGDHAGTARAIAQDLGIISAPEDLVLTGSELAELSNEQLKEIAPQVHVWARTSPEHKIRIVSALQARGHVVAMTGDGVNDAPALRKADVGIAMGIKGTEATKEAAEVVLADDNFASIERAVEEGRRIYDNIRKSIAFLLPTNGAQSLVILVAMLFGFSLPLQPTQVLWINMVTAVTLSLPLAYEPAEVGIMARPPRNTRASLITGRLFGFVLAVSAVIAVLTLVAFHWAQSRGFSLADSQSIAVQTLAFGQLFYLFTCRFLSSSGLSFRQFEGSGLVWIAAGALVAFQVIFLYLPPMHEWFHSSALGWEGWLVPFALGAVTFGAAEVLKFLIRPLGVPSARR
ncbi:MAG TPA: HAD-IC family P-type ATPase [Pseudoclavibacter sp.]|nr:HAD-IC family P-type ATPase [Pseudoclavibacter sp.]